MSIVELRTAVFIVVVTLASAAAFGNALFLIISAKTEEAINKATRKCMVNVAITLLSLMWVIIGS